MSAPASSLADLDVRALDVPGVTFRLQRLPEHTRIMLVCSDERGATELWMTDLDQLPESVRRIPSVRNSGGVEIHSPVAVDGIEGPEHCDIVGGPCWSGGISLVGLPFPALIDAGDSATVLRLLAERHAGAFGDGVMPS